MSNSETSQGKFTNTPKKTFQYQIILVRLIQTQMYKINNTKINTKTPKDDTLFGISEEK